MKPFGRESDELTPPLELREAQPAVRRLQFHGMSAVVASRAMQRVLERAEKVARTDSTVLIVGESGVGKELVARAVHHFSPRADKPFVDLNCAAFPENLIESELFGFEKGAFSGADAAKPGMFEAAAEGTLFLDEIGELETRMQPKLLRVLDGHPYYRLGGSRKYQATARIVAATNATLEEAVQRGGFRVDLYHRLDAIQLRVPPLRERVEDIAPLCGLFLASTGCTLRDDALAQLERYAWPGNIRELRNVLTKAAVFADSPQLTPLDLPAAFGRITSPGGSAGHGYSLERIEEQTIRRALEQTGGHQQRAADILGISRRTLIRKLKTYAFTRPARQYLRGSAGHAGHAGQEASPGSSPGVKL